MPKLLEMRYTTVLDKIATKLQRLNRTDAVGVQELNGIGSDTVLPDVTGSRNFKMATVKLEILISQLLDKIGTKF
jgi:hypothetical protein